jgi:queuosine precursor transporter
LDGGAGEVRWAEAGASETAGTNTIMKTPPPSIAPLSQDPFPLSVGQRVYLACVVLFVTCLLLANIVGSKFFHFGTIRLGSFDLHIEHSVGMLVFPVTFILTDVINEFFGPRAARRVTYLGLAASLMAFAILWIARAVSPAPPERTFVPEEMFDRVFSSGGAMIVASMTAYMLGQLCDIVSFQVINRVTNGKSVWLRATGSTIVSQLVDSIAIMLVLFLWQTTASGQKASIGLAVEAGIKGYLIKFLIALCTTPLLYAVRAGIRSWCGLTPLRPQGVP